MTTTGIIHDHNSLEKHIQKNMGCMAGFFNLSGLLPGKRFSPKRLPSSSPFDSSSDAATAVSSVSSPAFSSELSKPTPRQKQTITPKPEPRTPTAEKEKSKSESSPVVVAKPSTSPWKFSRDAPRLSFDSRFVVDAKGSLYPREIRTTKYDSNDGEKQRPASPSVIARLMGLEATTPTEPERKVELRRSASESRSRDHIDQYQFLDSKNTFVRESNGIDQITQKLNARKAMLNHHYQAASEHPNGVVFGTVKTDKMTPRSRFDSADFLPKRTPLPTTTASVFGEIEKRLRMSGIEESSRDLETLKQILDAIHLKGLLHSTPLSNSKQKQNLVFNDHRFLDTSSPIVVMKPAKSRSSNESLKPVNRRNSNLDAKSVPVRSPRRERNNRSGGSAAAARRRPAAMRVETERGEREASSSPVQSPRARRGMDRTAGGSPRRTVSTGEICRREKARCGGEDEVVSIVSESSYSSCSHGDAERWKWEEHSREGGGRTLLERCDKLLHSIAAMTSTTTTVAATDGAVCINSIATELQPSPISVLDSSFNKDDDDELPSPVMKRTIDFKEELEQVVEQKEHEMLWSPSSSATAFHREQDSSDLSYVSDVLRASNYLHSSDIDRFLFLEKQQLLKGEDVSKSSLIRRRLIFDTITEILDPRQRIPPWNPASPARNLVSKKPSLSEIWSEFQRIQDPCPTNDLFDTICGVLKKDLTQDSISGWGNYTVEISDTVLDIERLIFKDLISETIRDLASFSGNNGTAPRRKLVF